MYPKQRQSKRVPYVGQVQRLERLALGQELRDQARALIVHVARQVRGAAHVVLLQLEDDRAQVDLDGGVRLGQSLLDGAHSLWGVLETLPMRVVHLQQGARVSGVESCSTDKPPLRHARWTCSPAQGGTSWRGGCRERKRARFGPELEPELNCVKQRA